MRKRLKTNAEEKLQYDKEGKELISNDHTDAATITPEANPNKDFCTIGLKSLFKKNTQPAPNVVPKNGIKIP
jgi:hypothetical protein